MERAADPPLTSPIVEILFFAGCPHVELAAARVRDALLSEGRCEDGALTLVEVGSDEEAVRLGFTGSPTVRVNGRDVEDVDGRTFALHCRVYVNDGRVEGAPCIARITAALVSSSSAASAAPALARSPPGEVHLDSTEGREIPIACVLSALSPAERARQALLLEEHLARVTDCTELEDGYAFRYPGDAALFARMAELVTLEHKCCPFLDFRLAWAGIDEAPIMETRGARAKAFIAEAFRARDRSATSCCGRG